MERTDTALLIVRIVFGAFLAAHGVNKLRGGLASTAGWFASIGMRRPRAQAVTAAATEIAAGLMLALGFLTPLACAAIVGTMTVAVVTVHWRVGFFIFLPGGGWEYCASIAAAATAVSVAGPGAVSVDNALGLLQGAGWAVAGPLLGVLTASLHLAATWRRPGGAS